MHWIDDAYGNAEASHEDLLLTARIICKDADDVWYDWAVEQSGEGPTFDRARGWAVDSLAQAKACAEAVARILTAGPGVVDGAVVGS